MNSTNVKQYIKITIGGLPPLTTQEEENDTCTLCFRNYKNGTYLAAIFFISAALINGFVQT